MSPAMCFQQQQVAAKINGMAATTAATAKGSVGGTDFTTLMIRNLPRRFTAWDVVSQLDGFMARTGFNFVYVPWDKSSVTNMGFAFINFMDNSTASAAMTYITDQEWSEGPTSRSRQVRAQPAHVQGLIVNLRRFYESVASKANATLHHEPLVFEHGGRTSLSVALVKSGIVPAPPGLDFPPGFEPAAQAAAPAAASPQKSQQLVQMQQQTQQQQAQQPRQLQMFKAQVLGSDDLFENDSTDDELGELVSYTSADSLPSMRTWSTYDTVGSLPTMSLDTLPRCAASAAPTIDDLPYLPFGAVVKLSV